MKPDVAGRPSGSFDGLSKRLRLPFRPPRTICVVMLAALACTAITSVPGSATPDLGQTTLCPTEECQVLHHPSDAQIARRVAVQLNQAVYTAKTIMEEPPSMTGTTLVLDPKHNGAVAEFHGITGKALHFLPSASQDNRFNYVSMNPTVAAKLDDHELMRVMLHEVGHYWWRVDGKRGNWLNEWGAIGMEVTSGAHGSPEEPPQCRANWSPKEDPRLHQETGRCVRRIGEHAMRVTRDSYLKQHGPAGEEVMRRAYRNLYGLALQNPGLTPTQVGGHFAELILDPEDARSVRESFSRLQ